MYTQTALDTSSFSSAREEADSLEVHAFTTNRKLFEEDQIWLTNLKTYFTSNVSNNRYTILQLAHDMSISERHLRRRCKQLLGCTPAQYFRNIRVQQARVYLYRRKFKTIEQLAYAVGYKDVPTFKSNYFAVVGRSVNTDMGKK
jgi:AraC-like DNA-binding protein